jgi:hypothetical protein
VVHSIQKTLHWSTQKAQASPETALYQKSADMVLRDPKIKPLSRGGSFPNKIEQKFLTLKRVDFQHWVGIEKTILFYFVKKQQIEYNRLINRLIE